MAQESKNNPTGIIVAIIGVVGAIIAAIITAAGNYNVEKMRQEVELTKIALAAQSTEIIPRNTSVISTEVIFPASTVAPTISLATSTVQSVSLDLSAKLYVLGYKSSDLAVIQATSNCSDCEVIFLSSLNDLPDNRSYHTFNVTSPTANLSDGCRTKQELAGLSVTLMIANNYTPCSPKQEPSAVATNCPSPSSYATNVQALTPGTTISGPATIHPYDGGAELAQSLGLGWIARWGINIPFGTTVQIPQSVTLFSGKEYIPNGYVDIYSGNASMEAAQQCWLTSNP